MRRTARPEAPHARPLPQTGVPAWTGPRAPRSPFAGKALSWRGEDFPGFRGGRTIGDWRGIGWLGILVQAGVIADPWK